MPKIVKTAARRATASVAARKPARKAAPHEFREGSKLGDLVNALASPKNKRGLTVEKICDMLGYDSHSVQAVLTTLRSKNYRIENLGERGAAAYRIA